MSKTTNSGSQILHKLEREVRSRAFARLLLAALVATRQRRWALTAVLVGRHAVAWATALVDSVGQEFIPVVVGRDDAGPMGRRHLLQVVAKRLRSEEGHILSHPPPLVLHLAGVVELPYWAGGFVNGTAIATDALALRPPGLVVILGERLSSLVYGELPGFEPTEPPTSEARELLSSMARSSSGAEVGASDFLKSLPHLKEGLAKAVTADEKPLLELLVKRFAGRGFGAAEAVTAVEMSTLVLPWLHAPSASGRGSQLARRLSLLAARKPPEFKVTEAFDTHRKARVYRVVRSDAEGRGASQGSPPPRATRVRPHRPSRSRR